NSGDGGGRDADATDPGDFVSNFDLFDPNLVALCGGDLHPQPSSWHGTRVAGVIGAAANNALGVAGISFGSKILPVRVLGKCGGYDSDIIAGVRWAAGLPVPGIPDNPNPARVINLSLGSSGGCTAAFAEAVAELSARGALIVAPAGNETGPVEAPANCPGVLAVAGVRHIGTKVGYSSFGPEVSVSAPAGNCVNPAPGPCAFSIRTTTNLGTEAPGPSGYTDEFDFNIGTSFSAPQAAGVAALMLSVNPGLAPVDIIARMKQSARAFPIDAGVPTCPSVATGADTSGQCNCTAATCGAGILDAAAAVAAASPPSVQLVAGWNLIGNSTEGAVDVGAVFGDSWKVATLWKWLPDAATWAFYSPALADGGAAFAAGNGYAFLSSVASGEGFWVNAKEPLSVFIGSGNLRATASLRDGTGAAGGNPLPSGWSLIAVGDNPEPRAFANGIAAAPPAAGTQAAASLTTLWAWHAGNAGWFFYAPALDNSGELASFIGTKGYFDFGALGKTLDATTGFWVNRP
ncbi:MAG: S8 family serine peptidase, partial [Betaproteobacteria bacterium]|nr:S8 family serine peptidase [Betaproteobacteria bacterium]